MQKLRIRAASYVFTARLEEERAPKTCAAIRKMLPFKSKLVHVRWSGEATWVPMGDTRIGIDFENHTSHPAPGQILVYPGGISEMEILFPYGATSFASNTCGVHNVSRTLGFALRASFKNFSSSQ